jgi:hypothetical protein
MKRLAVVAVVLVGLLVAQVASAHHTVYGSAKRAVLQSLVTKAPSFIAVNNGHNCQTLAIRCWQVVVSANSWASSDDAGPGNNGMGEWAYISHLQHGRWHYVGGWGEGIGLACGRVGIPLNVSRDLRVYCA